MLITIGSLALIFVICALLTWALHSLVPYAAGALGVILLNVPGAHWTVQFSALGLTLVCFVVSCINQHNVPEGAARTEAQKRSESRADRFAVFAVVLAVIYTVGTWIWQFLDYLGVDDFFVWLWRQNLRLPIIAGLVLAYVAYRLVRRARRRKAGRSTTSGSTTPAPASNLSSVS